MKSGTIFSLFVVLIFTELSPNCFKYELAWLGDLRKIVDNKLVVTPVPLTCTFRKPIFAYVKNFTAFYLL